MSPSRASTRTPPRAAPPPIDTDEAVVSSFLSDAAHVPGGFAAGVVVPRDAAELAAIVTRAEHILAVGAQSSLTGGATPRGEVVVSTRALDAVTIAGDTRVRAGAGVPLATLQQQLAAAGLYYPPVPTFDGAFVGGTVATNAAGAATFKYGSTRPWVEAISVVLASGELLDLARGDATASADGRIEIARPAGEPLRVPVPTYTMPEVAKLSAGYFARPGMDLVDLFIGSEGTLGIVTEVTLRVVPLPRRCLALVTCTGDAQAFALTAILREEAAAAWRGEGPLDVAAIEYIDARALRAVPDGAFTRAHVPRPGGGAALLLVQIETADDDEPALERLLAVLESTGVAGDPALALPGDDRGAGRLLALREAVPAAVNAAVAAAQAADPGVEKTAGDVVVPVERLGALVALCRAVFERRGLDYALWGHASDGNLHPNVLPRTRDDVEGGRDALLEIAHGVVALGGAPLAEHGVGRSALKQRLLRELYGDEGIDQMRAVKRALDPAWKLAPGVLFAPPGAPNLNTNPDS